jgi:hypothetical protein
MALFLPKMSKQRAEICDNAWRPRWRGGLYENQRMRAHFFHPHRILAGIAQAQFCLSTETTNSDFQFSIQGSAF